MPMHVYSITLQPFLLIISLFIPDFYLLYHPKRLLYLALEDRVLNLSCYTLNSLNLNVFTIITSQKFTTLLVIQSFFS